MSGASRKNEWTLVTFENIREYIEQNQISQLAFTRELGITNSTFHNWKNGKTTPDLDDQGKIHALLVGKPGGTKVAKKKTAKKKAVTKKKTARTLPFLPAAAPSETGWEWPTCDCHARIDRPHCLSAVLFRLA